MTNNDAGLIAAIRSDHPCDDVSCDIATALRAGFPRVAAWLLESATDELPALTEWHKRGGKIPYYLEKCPGWKGWLKYHEQYGVKCPACETFNYGDDTFTPDQCGNCLAEIPGGTEV